MDPLQGYVQASQTAAQQDIFVEDPYEILSVEMADTQGNSSIAYSNPSFPYPRLTLGQGTSIESFTKQLVIYNDPRAALQAVQDLGLRELM
jgi:hypothetical protein